MSNLVIATNEGVQKPCARAVVTCDIPKNKRHVNTTSDHVGQVPKWRSFVPLSEACDRSKAHLIVLGTWGVIGNGIIDKSTVDSIEC